MVFRIRASLFLLLFSTVFYSCSAAAGGRKYAIGGPDSSYALVLVSPVQRYPGGEVRSGRISGEGFVALDGDAVPCTGDVLLRRDGTPVKLFLSGPVPLAFVPGSGHRVLFAGETCFDASGMVKAGILAEPAALVPVDMRQTVLFPKGTEIWFDGCGMVESFRLNIPPERISGESGLNLLKRGFRYWFENGTVSADAQCVTPFPK